MRDAILMVMTLSIGVGALRNPYLGMLAYVGYSLLGPHSYTWSFARSFPHVQLIAAATIVGYMLSTRKSGLPRQRQLAYLGILLGIFTLSTLMGLEPALAYVELIRMVKVLLMVLFLVLIIDDEQRLYQLLRVITLSLGLYAVKAGIFFLGSGGAGLVVGPSETFLEANNSIGVALAMNVPLLVYMARMESRPWLRTSMRIMTVLSYPAVIGTSSRGAWLGLALVSVLLLLRRGVSPAKVAIAAVFAALILAVFPLTMPDNIVKRYEALENYEEDGSAQSRFWSWRFCATVGLSRPVLGAGFNFHSIDAYRRYMPEMLEKWPGKLWSCHSTWLGMLSDHGVPAFALWITLLVSCLTSLRQMRRYAPDDLTLSWVRSYGTMLEISLLGFILMATFLDFAYFELYYQFVGVIVIINEILRRRASAEDTGVTHQPHLEKPPTGGPGSRWGA